MIKLFNVTGKCHLRLSELFSVSWIGNQISVTSLGKYGCEQIFFCQQFRILLWICEFEQFLL